MKRDDNAKQDLPETVHRAIETLGEQVRIARKRRGLTMDEMAGRMFVSRQTLARLEKGEPGVSLGVLAAALWVLGLERDIGAVAAPDRDEVGKFRERQSLPKRVRHAQGEREPEF